MNARGQAATEAILVIVLLLLAFLLLAVVVLNQDRQTALLHISFQKQQVCNSIAESLTRVHVAGKGTHWRVEIGTEEVQVLDNGFVAVRNPGELQEWATCSFTGTVDANYTLSQGIWVIENEDGTMVIQSV